jgi:hypothetical protein
MDGWMDGWMDEWIRLRITLINSVLSIRIELKNQNR